MTETPQRKAEMETLLLGFCRISVCESSDLGGTGHASRNVALTTDEPVFTSSVILLQPLEVEECIKAPPGACSRDLASFECVVSY